MSKAAFSVMCFSLIFTSGCTSFIHADACKDDGCRTVEASLDRISGVKKTLEDRIETNDTIKLGAGVLTFIGVAGGGTAAAFGASSELALGFGIGGATAYAAGGLLVPEKQTAVYRSGHAALSCLEIPARYYVSAIDEIIANKNKMVESIFIIKKTMKLYYIELIKINQKIIYLSDEINKAKEEKKSIEEIKKIEHNKEILENILNILLIYQYNEQSVKETMEFANGVVDLIISTESNQKLISLSLDKALDGIINDINNQAYSAAPTLDAVLAAANGVATKGSVPTDEKLSNRSMLMATDNILVKSEENETAESIKKNAMGYIDTVNEESTKLNNMANLTNSLINNFTKIGISVEDNTKSCNVKLQIAGLSISPSTVPVLVTKGLTVRLKVLGGQPSYTAKWKDTAPAGVSLDVTTGNEILLNGQDSIQEGKGTLIIDDQSPTTPALEVPVTTKKSAATS
jgi:tellurite resistance protein